MKIVAAKAPMSRKAREVLADPAKARRVFETVVLDRASSATGRVHDVGGLRFRSQPPRGRG